MSTKYSRKKKNRRTIDVEHLVHRIGDLPDAPAPTRRVATKRNLIEQLRGPLLEALTQRHYSSEKLAAVLREEGFEIHASTLRRYLGSVSPDCAVTRLTATPPRSIPAQLSTGGSTEPAAKLEAALAGAPSKDQTDASPSSEPAASTHGTFTPRPERPIDWLPKEG